MVQTKNPSPAHKPPTANKRIVILKRKSSAFAKPVAVARLSPVKAVPKSPIRSSPRKIANPFKKDPTTPAKKARLDVLSPTKASLRSAEKRILDSPKSSRNFFDASNTNVALDFSALSSMCTSTVAARARKTLEFSAPKKEFSEVPVDLRPGNKLRITSLKPFPWMKEARAKASSPVAIEIDDIVAGEVAISGVDLEARNKDILSSLNPMARLGASTYYYQYPDMTEFQLSMFPRLDAQTRLSLPSKSAVSLQQMGQAYVDSTFEKWKKTFEKLYNNWRLSDRRTFYLFAHNSTTLFTKYTILNSSITGNENETIWSAFGKPKHRVIITPTTSGLRQILRDQGIKFELPFTGKNLNRRLSKDVTFACNDTLAGFEVLNADTSNDGKSKSQQTPTKSPIKSSKLLESPGDEDNDNAFDHDEWLNGIGISPRTTLGFGRHATISDSNLSPEDAASKGPVDYASANEATRSTAVITDPLSIQALFKFICVSKDLRSNTGAQAGLPPTIIASSPFMNGSLKSLNISSQIVKRSRASSHEYIIVFESGPILPYMPSMIASFLQSVPELSTRDNEIKITVSGRNAYLGINECIDAETDSKLQLNKYYSEIKTSVAFLCDDSNWSRDVLDISQQNNCIDESAIATIFDNSIDLRFNSHESSLRGCGAVLPRLRTLSSNVSGRVIPRFRASNKPRGITPLQFDVIVRKMFAGNDTCHYITSRDSWKFRLPNCESIFDDIQIYPLLKTNYKIILTPILTPSKRPEEATEPPEDDNLEEATEPPEDDNLEEAADKHEDANEDMICHFSLGVFIKEPEPKCFFFDSFMPDQPNDSFDNIKLMLQGRLGVTFELVESGVCNSFMSEQLPCEDTCSYHILTMMEQIILSGKVSSIKNKNIKKEAKRFDRLL